MIQVKRSDANLVATHLVAVVRLNSLIRCGIKEHTRNRMRLITKLCILVLDVSENLIQIARVQCVDIVLRLRRMRIVFGVNDENRIIKPDGCVKCRVTIRCPIGLRGVLLHHFIKLRVSHAVHTIDEPFIFFIGDTDSPRSVKVYTRQCVFFAQSMRLFWHYSQSVL